MKTFAIFLVCSLLVGISENSPYVNGSAGSFLPNDPVSSVTTGAKQNSSPLATVPDSPVPGLNHIIHTSEKPIPPYSFSTTTNGLVPSTDSTLQPILEPALTKPTINQPSKPVNTTLEKLRKIGQIAVEIWGVDNKIVNRISFLIDVNKLGVPLPADLISDVLRLAISQMNLDECANKGYSFKQLLLSLESLREEVLSEHRRKQNLWDDKEKTTKITTLDSNDTTKEITRTITYISSSQGTLSPNLKILTPKESINNNANFTKFKVINTSSANSDFKSTINPNSEFSSPKESANSNPNISVIKEAKISKTAVLQPV